MQAKRTNAQTQALDAILSMLKPALNDGLAKAATKLSNQDDGSLETVLSVLRMLTRSGEVREEDTSLSPGQRQVFDGLSHALNAGHIVWVWGGPGMGKTTILHAVHHLTGGAFLTMREFVDAMRDHHPLALEETLQQLLLEALDKNDFVFLDDLQILANLNAGYCLRRGFLEAPLKALASYTFAANKKLIVGGDTVPDALRVRCYPFGIDQFRAEDYAFLCTAFLGREMASQLDFEKIHRFAPNLNGHQLRGSCGWLKREERLDTERFIQYLESQHVASNVDLQEVQPVDLQDLKGVDDLIRSLETHVILPLENEALAAELHLTPKRGVLLAGPPGTGKTTVGRALAHRLKSKFFLIDGTFISGTSDFYAKVQKVFDAAKQGAASVIFIDDSDVIFENGAETGLYRYLLTMLDGLESESVGQICVMLTAMDVGNIPPALLRSGRVELWLETRLPGENARAAILATHLADLAPAIGQVNIPQLVAATEGLTGADLKRLAEDGKLLFAYDKAGGLSMRPSTDYFLAAVETLRANKEQYAQAEARAKQLHASRPAWFDPSND